MKDTVFIKGLELNTLIGVYDFERHAPQRIIVDLEMTADLATAGASDDVNDTVDYGRVAETLGKIATESDFKLLEALGEKMCSELFTHFALEQITLTINKADIIANAEGVGIVLRRNRLQHIKGNK